MLVLPSVVRPSTSRCSAIAESITRAGPRLLDTRHRGYYIGEQTPPFDDDIWELYFTTKDWTQANDVSKQFTEKLHELQRLWLIEAVRYNVLPMDDDLARRMNPDTAGRPVLIKGQSQV